MVIAAIAALVPVMLSSPTAYSCEYGYSTPSERLDGANAVFSGTVAKVQGFGVEDWPNLNAVFFEVDRYWKNPEGEDFDKQIVFTNTSEGACGYPFQEGEKYLVYASPHHHHKDLLYTWLATSRLFEAAQEEDLPFFGDAVAAPPTVQIGWEEQMEKIVFRPPPSPQPTEEERISGLLLIIGAGGVVTGIVAFFSIRRLRNGQSHSR
jgi:hypothetical protein